MSPVVKVIVATMVFFIAAALILSVFRPEVLGFGQQSGAVQGNAFGNLTGILSG